MCKNDLTFGASILAAMATFAAAIITDLVQPPAHVDRSVVARLSRPAASAPATQPILVAQARGGSPSAADR